MASLQPLIAHSWGFTQTIQKTNPVSVSPLLQGERNSAVASRASPRAPGGPTWAGLSGEELSSAYQDASWIHQ